MKIADVARLAGVSPATVSRALNHPQIVSPVLRERIGRAVSELSYTRDGAARALKSGRMHTVGAVVPTLNISIFAEGVEAMQNRLSEHGYTLFLANSQYDSHKELQEVRALLERGVDGIALVGDAFSDDVLAAIRHHGVPLVTTYVSEARAGVPAIGIDNEQATFEMTQYLLGLGHREFGVIANIPATNDRSLARFRGVVRALAGKGIELGSERVVRASHSLSQGRSALRHLLAIAPEITAVICTTDTLAHGAIAEARALGIAVPGGLSVTGFDDIELSAHTDPALTTINIPAGEIGRSAADHLANAAAGIPIPWSVALPYRLVLRGSAAAPRGRRKPS